MYYLYIDIKLFVSGLFIFGRRLVDATFVSNVSRAQTDQLRRAESLRVGPLDEFFSLVGVVGLGVFVHEESGDVGLGSARLEFYAELHSLWSTRDGRVEPAFVLVACHEYFEICREDAVPVSEQSL